VEYGIGVVMIEERAMHVIEGGWFWGMHLFWWLFWFALIALFFSLPFPAPRSRARETPMQILQRRYAAGELSTEEYEERKQRLKQDTAKA
jgi:putative membrane protein